MATGVGVLASAVEPGVLAVEPATEDPACSILANHANRKGDRHAMSLNMSLINKLFGSHLTATQSEVERAEIC